MKTLSIVSPCFNEELNVAELYHRVRRTILSLPGYSYEHIFIDNASTDSTLSILRQLAASDPNVKVIVNTRNFGYIRSPFHGLLQGSGDAVVLLASDLQDPPELIAEFVREWEAGSPIVIGVKTESEENSLFYWARTRYYNLVQRWSDVRTFPHFTGFGLYDSSVITHLRSLSDVYPYFRGMIAEIGLPHKEIEFKQPLRKRGISSSNFYRLFDIAMLGVTTLSKVPLRLITLSGFLIAGLSATFGFAYLLYKLLYWDRFDAGVAPMVLGVFFLGAVQLLSLGILGEYVGFVHTQVLHRPLVFEKERINFDKPCSTPLPGPPPGSAS